MIQVHPYLVGAAGFEPKLYDRYRFSQNFPFKNRFEMGDGPLPAPVHCSDNVAAVRAEYGKVNRTLFFRQNVRYTRRYTL